MRHRRFVRLATVLALAVGLTTSCTSSDPPVGAPGSPTATRDPRAVARMLAFEQLDRCVRTAQSAARGQPRLGYVAVDRRRRQVVVAFASPVPNGVEQPLAEIGCDVRAVRVDYSTAELNAARRRVEHSRYQVASVEPDGRNGGLVVVTEDPRLLSTRDPRRLFGLRLPVRIRRGVVDAD